MMFKTHMAFAILAAMLTRRFFIETHFAVFLVLVLLGAMLPDIDNKRSKISQKAKIVARLINPLTKHRGIFHSLFIPLGIYFLLDLFFPTQYGAAVFVGYLSHIIIDAMTPMGVNFLHPLTTLRVHGAIETNSFVEKILLVSFILLIIFLML